MNYRPIFIFPTGERGKNGQVFATKDEALSSAAARFMVWTYPTSYEAEETGDTVTYRWTATDGDVLFMGEEA